MSLLFISCTKEQTPLAPIVINHYDWNPDSLVVDSMLVDLNNDNADDIKFLIERVYQGATPSGGPYYNYFAKCISVNSEVTISLGNAPNCIMTNDLISDELTWETSKILKGQVIAAGDIGDWNICNADGYIGIRFESNGEVFYGWIRVDVNYNDALEKRYEIICFEYAMSETSNAFIEAGQIE